MRYLLICATVAIATACSGRNEAPQIDSAAVPSTVARGTSLPIRALLNENNSGIADSTRMVLTDSVAWRDAHARIYANHGTPPTIPGVDFTREIVVLVALGERGNGGYSIGIDSARKTVAEVIVYVRSASSGPSCMTTAAMTQPVHAVALSSALLPVRFVEESIVNDCS